MTAVDVSPELRRLALAERLVQKAAPSKGDVPLGGMVMEPKFDGWRIIAHRHLGGVTFYTRTGGNVVGKLPAIEAEIARFPMGTWIDGEAVADGWNTVQSVLTTMGVHRAAGLVRFVAFDLLALGGHDLRAQPLSVRREWLVKAVARCAVGDPFEVVDQQPASMALHEQHLAAGFEGSIVKRPESRYASGKKGHGWTKLKPQETRDVVVMGFEPGKGGITGMVGAIVFGAFDGDTLVELGKCSGFDMRTREAMTARPDEYLGRVFELAHHDLGGELRHPQWKRWRDDKPAADCRIDNERIPA